MQSNHHSYKPLHQNGLLKHGLSPIILTPMTQEESVPDGDDDNDTSVEFENTQSEIQQDNSNKKKEAENQPDAAYADNFSAY